jgi:hypothetical protein
MTLDINQIQNPLDTGSQMLCLTKQEVINIGPTAEDILGLTPEPLIEHGHKRFEMPAKIGVHPYDDVFTTRCRLMCRQRRP